MAKKSKSVLQENKQCYECKCSHHLESHHIFFGNPNRKHSEELGLKVWLCSWHHRGGEGVHFDRVFDLELKRMAQEHYEKHIGTREEFRLKFGKSYLE